MKPWALPLALLLVFTGGACSDRGGGDGPGSRSSSSPGASSTPGASITSTPGTATGPAEFDGALALEHIRVLAEEIGPRVSGTDGEQRAVEYLAEQFRGYGYHVELMEFEFSGDRFNRVGSVVQGQSSYEALALVGSASGKVTGPTAWVSLADDAGIGGRDLQGKIAVASRGTTPFADKYEKAKAAGATALIIINNAAGPVSGDLRRTASIPVVAVPGEAEASLKAAAMAGQEVTVDAPGGETTKSVNVIARPADEAVCSVLVGGHHDTVPAAPGANDNASGTATVVELARAFAADGKLDPGLCFTTFGAEESGLFGSQALAKRLKDAGQLPRFMVNADVTGIGESVTITAATGLGSRAMELARQLGVKATLGDLPANSSSDYASFRELGVPTVFIWSDGDFPIHTPEDVYDAIQVEELDRVGDLDQKVIEDLVAQVARG